MRLLFICQTSENGNDATPNLAKRLASTLVQLGHSVALLDVATCTESPVGVQRFCVDSKAERLLHTITGGYFGVYNKAETLWKLACHPTALWAAIRLVIFKKPLMQSAYQKKIETISSKQTFDFALAFCAPHITATALAKAEIPCPKAACMFDPYSLMPFYADAWHQKNEQMIYQNMQHIFVTELLWRELKSSHLQDAIEKCSVLHFPAICKKDTQETDVLRGEYKNLVFVGNVYNEIRNPEPLLALFSNLSLSNWRLVFVGGGWQNFSKDFLLRYQNQLKDRLKIVDTLPQEQAFAVMQQADILADIGNGNTTQLPSKVFDYMSAGRPVLQITAHEQDAAEKLYQKYPLFLSVSACDSTQASVQTRVADFLQTSWNKSVPFAQVERLYPEWTPHSVAQECLRTLQ